MRVRLPGECLAIEVRGNGYLSDASYGSGRKCLRRFRAEAGACSPIEVPANAYLVESSYGPGWACERDYKSVNAACDSLDMLSNAHINYSGNDWECNQPYLKRDSSCTLS